VDSGVEMSLKLFVCIGVMEESTVSIIKVDLIICLDTAGIRFF
jgi:hypothetical protein